MRSPRGGWGDTQLVQVALASEPTKDLSDVARRSGRSDLSHTLVDRVCIALRFMGGDEVTKRLVLTEVHDGVYLQVANEEVGGLLESDRVRVGRTNETQSHGFTDLHQLGPELQNVRR